MRIEERKSKKAKKGVTYRVKVDYVDEYGIKCTYSKSGFSSKAKAREHGTEMEYKLKNGLIKKESTKTLGECFLEVMELEKDKLARNTIISYFSQYTYHIVPSGIASMPISKVNYSVLQKFFNEQDSASSLDVQKTIIKKAFKHAIRLGIVTFDPTSVLIMPKYDPKRKTEAITVDDLRAMAANISASSAMIEYSYIIGMYCGYYLGLRISEILALEKSDFDFEANTVLISKKVESNRLKKKESYVTDRLKTKKSRAVLPIPKELKYMLLKWFDYNPFDFVCSDQNGDIVSGAAFRSALKKAAKKIGIDFHPHCLRHSYVTCIVQSGTDIKTASELARHTNIQTTLNIYTHSNIEAKQDAVSHAFDSKCPNFVPNPKYLN